MSNDFRRYQQIIFRILIHILWRLFHKNRFKAPPGVIRLDITPDENESPRIIITMEQKNDS